MPSPLPESSPARAARKSGPRTKLAPRFFLANGNRPGACLRGDGGRRSGDPRCIISRHRLAVRGDAGLSRYADREPAHRRPRIKPLYETGCRAKIPEERSLVQRFPTPSWPVSAKVEPLARALKPFSNVLINGNASGISGAASEAANPPVVEQDAARPPNLQSVSPVFSREQIGDQSTRAPFASAILFSRIPDFGAGVG